MQIISTKRCKTECFSFVKKFTWIELSWAAYHCSPLVLGCDYIDLGGIPVFVHNLIKTRRRSCFVPQQQESAVIMQ